MRLRARVISQWVWLINGVILLAALAVTGIAVLVGWMTSRPGRPAAGEAATIPISTAPAHITYDPPATTADGRHSVVLMRDGRGLPSLPTTAGRGAGAVVNVAVITSDGSGRLLLNRPARVAWLTFPGAPDWMAGPLGTDAPPGKVLLAVISSDSTGDGVLSGEDGAELFAAALDGGPPQTVLPAGLHVRGIQATDGAWLITAYDPAEKAQRAFGYDGNAATALPTLDSLVRAAAAISRGVPGS